LLQLSVEVCDLARRVAVFNPRDPSHDVPSSAKTGSGAMMPDRPLSTQPWR
jgi:hypothetical protein